MTSISLLNPQQAMTALQSVYRDTIKPMTMAGHRLRLTVKPETRSTAQNSRLWAMLDDISSQMDWHGRRLAKEDWKHIFSASLKKQDAVPGIDGGFVVLGQSTSKMTVQEMTDLMMLMEAFGAEHGIVFHAQEEFA